MRRTTIYLEPDLEVLLKLEVQRARRPMADIIREALRAHLTREPRRMPPGAGAFTSGTTTTAERAEEVLAETGFGTAGQPTRGRRPVARSRKR